MTVLGTYARNASRLAQKDHDHGCIPAAVRGVLVVLGEDRMDEWDERRIQEECGCGVGENSFRIADNLLQAAGISHKYRVTWLEDEHEDVLVKAGRALSRSLPLLAVFTPYKPREGLPSEVRSGADVTLIRCSEDIDRGGRAHIVAIVAMTEAEATWFDAIGARFFAAPPSVFRDLLAPGNSQTCLIEPVA